MMDPPYKWKFSFFLCPSCGKSILVSLKSPSKDSKQPRHSKLINDSSFSSICVRCFSNYTGLAMVDALKRHHSFKEGDTCWEMSTYGSTVKYLSKYSTNLLLSEFVPGVTSGNYVNGILIEDVRATSFNSSSIDLITCNQVFEHVPEFQQALSECHRILKSKGALFFSVPLYSRNNTLKYAEIVQDKLCFLGDPEFHDSRMGGPASAPVFWHFSINDITNLVSSFGFSVQIKEISPNSSVIAYVIIARKR